MPRKDTMNPKTYHKRMCQFNTVSDNVRKRRINKETKRQKLAKASFVPNPRLILADGKRKVLVKLHVA